jgi:hypothetical protein
MTIAALVANTVAAAEAAAATESGAGEPTAGRGAAR